VEREDEIRLRPMLDAAREPVALTANRTWTHRNTDRALALGLVKEIEIIGEAASKVSVATQAAVPAIPWADVVGMRNRLVHAYFDINLNVVWSTVTAELPPLIRELEELVSGVD
jgi:uncharacterized protein with HEPN domain